MFEVENRFYHDNRDNLWKKYLGKAIVIRGEGFNTPPPAA